MRTSYLDYAMSVIIGRAIPDVRDGLKPVHRRILFSMHELKPRPGQLATRSARSVVGDVLGKYHPHGDPAVYDALVRMAQHFCLRHLLIDGQGNFGSVDGDPPAAYRYTEARLSRIAVELLADIEKDTVDFSPNYDDSEQEPMRPAGARSRTCSSTAPAASPSAWRPTSRRTTWARSSTPPSCSFATRSSPIDDLMQHRPGPRLPHRRHHLRPERHRAGLPHRPRQHRDARPQQRRKDRGKGDREQIVVIEIPYQVNKARLHAKIAELRARTSASRASREVRDESDRDGMRLVIELKKDVFPQVVLNQLYRLTDLQTTLRRHQPLHRPTAAPRCSTSRRR